MRNEIVYTSSVLTNRQSTPNDLTLYITLDVPSNIVGGSRNTGNEIKAKQVFVNYFKYAVPALFKGDSRFYVDYEHTGNKTKKGKISRSGHTSSESQYIVLFAKNIYGFVINSWIIDLRIGEHDSPTDVDPVTKVDLRQVSREAYLNSYDDFGSHLDIDRETFEKMTKTFKEIIVKCGVSFKSNTTVKLPDTASKRCKNVAQALKFIDSYRDALYKSMSDNIDVFYYKGYAIKGNDTSCIVMDLHDEVIKSDISMSVAKSFIDDLTEGSDVGKVYGSIDLSLHFSMEDLFDFADSVIEEVDRYITDQTYYIAWRDIHFEYGFEVLVLDVIDSDGVGYVADINVNIDNFIHSRSYRLQCIDDFVDQITDAYSGEEIG